ncbi:MAG: sterol desaturase family protein [Proteobacteria bacterium]|nr:sterol desaturase family protein [Pseudomonadota bacterium]
MRRLGLGHRKIQQRRASRADLRREVLQSVQAVLVYAFASGFVAWGIDSGVLRKPEHGTSLGSDLVLLAAMIVAHDAYFYWAHRAMHHPRLFRLFHRDHHRSVTPTPWAAYSFAIPEALVMVLFVPLWLWLVPTPVWVTLAWLIFQITRNAMGHAGYELMPRWWLSTPLTRWINTTTHHDLHHSGGFNTNYGLYFTWWDRLMGTEHPRYAQEFARVVQGGSQSATGQSATGQPATAPAHAALDS